LSKRNGVALKSELILSFDVDVEEIKGALHGCPEVGKDIVIVAFIEIEFAWLAGGLDLIV
jgi:hypothetical protein